jgi:hypothetical protein
MGLRFRREIHVVTNVATVAELVTIWTVGGKAVGSYHSLIGLSPQSHYAGQSASAFSCVASQQLAEGPKEIVHIGFTGAVPHQADPPDFAFERA